MQFINIAGYKFIALTNLDSLREELLQTALSLNCKGTILLSEEGININLSGTLENIKSFKLFLSNNSFFQSISFRESFSNEQPFKFMRVKIKKEIITMHHDAIHPEKNRAESLSPQDLKKWLDEDREMVLLDTRNEYEINFGTFKKAIHLGIKDFGEFPEASQKIEKEKPVVMFCTGGIRCEKAALHLLDSGFSNVYQLEGGILNYFSEVGGEHYQGECFVFDQRISLNSKLQESGTTQCLNCQGPIQKDAVDCSAAVCQK